MLCTGHAQTLSSCHLPQTDTMGKPFTVHLYHLGTVSYPEMS